MAVISNAVGAKLVEILGLPSDTKSVSIHFAANEAVTAEVAFLLNEEQCEKLIEVAALYELTEIDRTETEIQDAD